MDEGFCAASTYYQQTCGIDIRFYKGPGSSDRPVTTHLPVRTFKFASDSECVRTVRTHTRVTRYDSGAGQEADSESAGSVTVMT
jgi:hypothetical protein